MPIQSSPSFGRSAHYVYLGLFMHAVPTISGGSMASAARRLRFVMPLAVGDDRRALQMDMAAARDFIFEFSLYVHELNHQN